MGATVLSGKAGISMYFFVFLYVSIAKQDVLT